MQNIAPAQVFFQSAWCFPVIFIPPVLHTHTQCISFIEHRHNVIVVDSIVNYSTENKLAGIDVDANLVFSFCHSDVSYVP
jgi:hypothetical protein